MKILGDHPRRADRADPVSALARQGRLAARLGASTGSCERAEGQERASSSARNAALAAEVRDLKTGTEAIEERARYELGMIRPDEVFYQYTDETRRPRQAPEAPWRTGTFVQYRRRTSRRNIAVGGSDFPTSLALLVLAPMAACAAGRRS